MSECTGNIISQSFVTDSSGFRQYFTENIQCTILGLPIFVSEDLGDIILIIIQFNIIITR